MSKSTGWMQRFSDGLLIPVALAGAFVLSGCAVNPLVSWQRPSSQASPLPLADAQRYADGARTAYQLARDKQVQATTGLNSQLLGLGVLGTALALAKAHRDALLGTAFLGASVYAFGQQNLNVQHRLVYEAGIDAIGCAKDAVQPLAMSPADREALESAMDGLDRALVRLSSAQAGASAALSAWKATEPVKNDALETSATAAIAAGGSAIAAGSASVAAGRILIRRADEAGDKLVAAVERIDAAVNKAVTATLPDPSSVFKVIAGLPGFAAGIVPGSDVAITAALAKSSAALKPEAAPQNGQLNSKGVVNFAETAALFRAIATLNEATDGLKFALAKVNGRLPTEESLKGFQSLKECGLGDVGFALKALPAAPSITAGADRKTPFVVSGGTPPYVVQLQVTPVKGVNLIPPMPFDSTVIFEITKDAEAGTVPVLVMDASKPSKSLVVPVEIVKAAGAAAPAAAAGNPVPEGGVVPSSPPNTATELVNRINATKVFKRADGGELSLTSQAVRKSDTQIDLALRCKPPPKAGVCVPAADARQMVVDAVSASGMAKMLNIAPLAGCVCAP